VRKTRPVAGFDIACKGKQNYQGLQVKDAWFILTDLGSLPVAPLINSGWELKKFMALRYLLC